MGPGDLELSVVIPTTDHYQQAWEGLALSWEVLSGLQLPIYIISDNLPITPLAPNMIPLSLGKPNYTKNDFSTKIAVALKHVQTKYVLLICDDMWPSHSITHMVPAWLRFCEQTGADALRIHEKLGWWDYDLEATQYFIHDLPVLRMKNTSSWLLSHNACIWNRDFLANVMVEGEDPWTNEIEGTRRIASNPHTLYHYNYRWYHQSYNFCRGKRTAFGRALVANLRYLKEFNGTWTNLNKEVLRHIKND